MEALEIKLIVKVCSIAGTRSSSYLLNCNEIKLILPSRIFLRLLGRPCLLLCTSGGSVSDWLQFQIFLL